MADEAGITALTLPGTFPEGWGKTGVLSGPRPAIQQLILITDKGLRLKLCLQPGRPYPNMHAVNGSSAQVTSSTMTHSTTTVAAPQKPITYACKARHTQQLSMEAEW